MSAVGLEAPGPVPHHSGAAVSIEHEELVLRRGDRSGVYVGVAIHSTVLGPALGGARMWHYADPEEALADAMRLASAMTLKASAAGLELGGGKGVICTPGVQPPTGELRRALLLDFGDLVATLGGRYVTAEDVGTGAADTVTIAERTEHVVGLPTDRGGSGDPSPVTALGVEAAIRACARRRFGASELDGVRVAVVGLGHVGSGLAARLARAGAAVIATDVDPAKREVAGDLGAAWVEPTEAMTAECEVLAPCALGGAINAENVEELRCAVVCGAANNLLATDRLADRLAARGILYAPDFIANAGGLISVYGELHGLPHERALALATRIEETMARILEVATERSVTPLRAAGELAAERLEAAREQGPSPSGDPSRAASATRAGPALRDSRA